MKRICLDCGVEYSPNVGQDGRMQKGYKICPRCKSTNTKEKSTPKFSGTRFIGTDEALRKWNDFVKHNNDHPEAIPSITLQPLGEPWYRWEKGRMEALGLR